MLFFKKKKIELKEIFTDDFVDIHSHLLPGIDDGAKNLEDSIALIQRMRAFGIKNLITTPHVLGDVYPNSSKTINSKLQEVQQELQRLNMNDISIRAAAEYMMDEQFQQRLKNDDLLPLKDAYILVEMSYFSAPMNLYEILFDIHVKGYQPVLAHPERYNFYHNDFESYYKLKKAGCLFQLNLLSLTPHYGKNVQNITHELLEKNLYDFVGTDTHHQNHLALLESIGSEKIKKRIADLVAKNSFFKD